MQSRLPANTLNVAGALGIAFIVLKLCHVIDWSWWLVTLPLWGGAAIVALVLIVVVGLVIFRAMRA